MNEFCKLVKKYSCKIIIGLCILIILLSLYNSGFLTETFQISPNDTTPTIVLFHADWCGHCKKLMPEWIKFEKAYHGKKGVNVLKIESDEDKSIMKLHGINGYPTIKYCPRGIYNKDGSIDYSGPRNYMGLAEFHEQYANTEEHFTEDLKHNGSNNHTSKHSDNDTSEHEDKKETNVPSGYSVDELFTL